jgi:hypothetical protein
MTDPENQVSTMHRQVFQSPDAIPSLNFRCTSEYEPEFYDTDSRKTRPNGYTLTGKICFLVLSDTSIKGRAVIPVQAGIQCGSLDCRLRGNDGNPKIKF